MLSNCAACGSLRDCKQNTGLCNTCYEEIFQSIKDYIKENGPCDVAVIGHALKIKGKIIRGYLADGLLQETFKEFNPNIKLCPCCGNFVSEEGVCDLCKDLNKMNTIRREIPNSTIPSNNGQKTGWHSSLR